MGNTITLTLAAEVRNAVKGITDVNGNLGKLQKTASSGVGTFKGMLAADAVVAGAKAIGGELKSVWDGLQENKAIAAQTAAVLKSTGGAAGISAQGVGALGDALEQKSLFDAEAIRSGENLLLTFTNIKNGAGKGNDVFNQTTQIMADMAQAMGTDPKAQAIQLGKALNDPVKGISALSRVGVTFTDQQKKQVAAMVKHNDTMGAQKLILGELSKEFGGSASKAAETWQGKLHGIKANLEGALEDQMAKVMPYLIKFADWAGKKIPPALDMLTAGAGRVGDKLRPLGDVLGRVYGFMKDNPETVKVFATTLGILAGVVGVVTAAQWLWNAAMAANPIGLIIITIAALVAAGVYLWTHTGELRSRMVAAWSGLVASVRGGIDRGVDWVKGFPGRAAGALGSLAGRLWSTSWGAFNRFNDATRNRTLDALRYLGGLPGRAVSALGSLGGRLFSTGWSALGRLGDAVSSGIDRVVGFLGGLPGRMLSAVGVDLWGAGNAIMSSFFRGLTSSWDNVKNFVGGIAGWIKDHKGPIAKDRHLLDEAGAAIMGSLERSLRGGMPSLTGTLGDITSLIMGGLDGARPAAGRLPGVRSSSAPLEVHLHVEVPPVADRAAIGRELVRALDAYFRSIGRPKWVAA